MRRITQEELEVLLEEFRSILGGEKLDLTYTDLSYLDFTNRSLWGVNFKGADVSGANFTGSYLTNSNIEEAANLDKATWNGFWIEPEKRNLLELLTNPKTSKLARKIFL
jgi:uncharacterized protein YjbI with pentapeptide repeats